MRSGESQRKDGRYAYKYTDTFGKPQFVYAMGHANITMTLNYYAHATFDSAQTEFFRLAA